MEALICLAILWVLWLISSKSWRRRLIQPLAAVVIGILVITSPIFVSLLTWGLTAKLPPTSSDRADAIVVLGRGPNSRPERAAAAWQLWQDERAPRIFISGMMDAEPMVQSLEENGVPISALSGEECSQSTEENAMFASAVLRPQGIEDILLVTDSPHMWRSLLVFRSAGFNVIPHAVALGSPTVPKRQQLEILGREYSGMISYALTGKFRERSPEELYGPSSLVVRKISHWGCQIPRQDSNS
ncbi:MAG: YdcF family protein [Elainellaceae cyanobacterium]